MITGSLKNKIDAIWHRNMITTLGLSHFFAVGNTISIKQINIFPVTAQNPATTYTLMYK